MRQFLSRRPGGNDHWAYYIITLIAVAAAYIMGQLPINTYIQNKLLASDVSPSVAEQFWTNPDMTLLSIPSYVSLILLLTPHVFGGIALLVCIRFIHKRPILAVLTGRPKFDWKRFGFGFLMWFLAAIVIECAMYAIAPENYSVSFDLRKWLPLLGVALLIIPIQTSVEELLFRGYIMQGIAHGTRSKWVAVLISSILFAALHLGNPEVKEFGLDIMLIYYLSTAFFLAIVTVLDNGLELAMGLHASTNIYGALIVTFQGSVLQLDSVLTIYEVNAWYMTLGFYVMITVFYVLARRRYQFAPASALVEGINFDSKADHNNAI